MIHASGRDVRWSASPATGTSDRSAGTAFRPLDILIVEDEVLIAMDVEQSVEDAGHSVVKIATTAASAVKAAEDHRPDVVLMDLRLADGSSGADAAREILQRFGIRSIFISGNLDSVTRARLGGLEPVAMLSKPFGSDELVAALMPVMRAKD